MHGRFGRLAAMGSIRKYLIAAVAVFFFAGGIGRSQVDTPAANNPLFHSWSGRSGTPCGTSDCWIEGVIAATRTSGTGTLTLRDNGAGCAGNCYFADAIGVTANTTNSILTFKVFAKGGLTVSTTGTVDVTVSWTQGRYN